MSWLKRVIARLLGLPIQPLVNPVPPTQTVGLVEQEHTAPSGNKRSAPTTKRKPASQKAKQPKKVAPKVTRVKSPKQEQKPVRKASGQKAR